MPSFIRFFQCKARRPASWSAEWNKIKEDLRLQQLDSDELARMTREDTWKVQTLELKVKIHNCHGCLKSVKKMLRNIDGVYQSTVDAAAGKVTVSGLMDPDTVMKKLRKAGKPAQLWDENPPAMVTQFQSLQVGDGGGGNDPLQANHEAVEAIGGGGAGGVVMAVKQEIQINDEDDIHKMLMKRLGMPPAAVSGDKEGGGNGKDNDGGNTNDGSGNGKKEGGGQQNGGGSQQQPQIVQNLELKVKFHCHGCVKRVKKALRNIDGVHQSTVDAATGKVTVSGVMDPETVMKKLRKAGKPAQLWGAENNPAVATQIQNLQLGGGDDGINVQQRANNAGLEGLQLPKGGAGGRMDASIVVPMPMPIPSLEAAANNDPNTNNNEDVKADGLNDHISNMLMKRLGVPPAVVGGDKEGGGNGTGNGGGNTNNGSGKKEGQVNEIGSSSQQQPQNGNGASGALALGSGNQPGQNEEETTASWPGMKSGSPPGAGRLGRPMIRGGMPPQEAGTMMRPLNMMDAGVEGLPGMVQQIGGGGTLVEGMPIGHPHMGGAGMKLGGNRVAMSTAAGFFTGVDGAGARRASMEMLPMPQQLPPPPPPEQHMVAVMEEQQHMAATMQHQQPMMTKGYDDHGHHDNGSHGYPPPPVSSYGYGYGLPAMPQYPPAYYYPMRQQHHHDNIFSDENPDAACTVM